MSEPKTNYDEKVSKATLEFWLPEGERELRMALDANRWYCVAWELAQDIRTNLKHVDHPKEATAVYEDIRKKLYEIMDDHGVCFE